MAASRHTSSRPPLPSPPAPLPWSCRHVTMPISTRRQGVSSPSQMGHLNIYPSFWVKYWFNKLKSHQILKGNYLPTYRTNYFSILKDLNGLYYFLLILFWLPWQTNSEIIESYIECSRTVDTNEIW